LTTDEVNNIELYIKYLNMRNKRQDFDIRKKTFKIEGV